MINTKSMVRKLNTIEELIKRAHDRDAPPLVIKYFATWCDPCKKSAPWFDDLARKMPMVEFASVDIDDVSLACETYGVRTIPAVHVWNRGARVKVFPNRESFPKVEPMLIEMLEHNPYANDRSELESAHVNSCMTTEVGDVPPPVVDKALGDRADVTPINLQRDLTRPAIISTKPSKSEKRRRDV